LILFTDTSALVKVYIEEQGSVPMRQTAAGAQTVIASHLAFAEIHATFARRRREDLLPAEDLEQLQLRFAADWKEIAKIPLVQEILSFVPELCERNPLRGADAIHLSSALLFSRKGFEVTFACSDRRLLEAAAAEGLLTFDPAQAA
jgi:predicted nucleic acid-binding protein